MIAAFTSAVSLLGLTFLRQAPERLPTASAQLSPAWTRCVNKEKASPDLQISGCTTVIQSGRETQKNRSIANNNRGDAHNHKGDPDHAISDANEAIGLDPKFAAAYSTRGEAYEAKNDPDHALADFDQALKLEPSLAGARQGRERVQGLLAKRLEPGAQTNSPAK